MIEIPRSAKRGATRRDFMRGAAFAGLGAALGFRGAGAAGRGSAARPFEAADPRSRLVLVRDEAAVDASHAVDAKVAGAMIDRAVAAFAGVDDPVAAWRTFVKPGDTVGVKFTHCGWMRVHTEQAVIDHVVARLKDAGVAADRIYAGDGGFPVERCTALVSVPSVKVHTLAGMAAAVKNYINFSPNASSYHGDGNARLPEIFLRPEIKGKTRLIVVDALRPYFGPGPQINPLHRWDYKGILVGTDPIAVDATCLAICRAKRTLFKGEDWPINPPPRFLPSGETEYKLGTADPARIRVEKIGWAADILI